MDTGAPADKAQPVIVQLRQATRGRHDAIEALLALDGEVSLAHYLRVLDGLALFLPAWEAAVEAALPTRLRPWFRSRGRAERIRRDLAALNRPPAGRASQALRLRGVAAAFGSIYVLEGAALGGQLIARRLAQAHGLDETNGAAYFAGAGSGTGELWREFREMLEEEVGPQPRARQEAADAACATFDALLRTLGPRLHEPAAA